MEKGEIARGRDSETQSKVIRGGNSRPVLVLTQVHPLLKTGGLAILYHSPVFSRLERVFSLKYMIITIFSSGADTILTEPKKQDCPIGKRSPDWAYRGSCPLRLGNLLFFPRSGETNIYKTGILSHHRQIG